MPGVPEHELKKDVITGWNSSFEVLEQFLEQRAAVCFLHSWTENQGKAPSDTYTLRENDITTGEETAKLLGPAKAATTTMCEEDHFELNCGIAFPIPFALLAQK